MTELSQIESAIAAGQKIVAIKKFREARHVGLLEAKQAVEWFIDQGQWPAQYSTPAATSAPAPSSAVDSPTSLAPIEQLIASRKIIPAIKELRRITGWGLAKTKGAVDDYRDLGAWPQRLLSSLGATQGADTSAEAEHDPPTSTPADTVRSTTLVRDEIEGFLDRDQKIRAVALLRDATGLSLHASKDAVDHFEAHRVWRPEILDALGE
ncbi:MAG: hypothetical protein K0V04_01540 [Deltaproteobacteria bacterium]|nr:hypothetical protein [Deltaproteobacteria bacterium]